jgi:Flp pilus assembly pilin Flp
MTMNWLKRIWREDDGVLSFEWTLLLTWLTIGIVGGLAGARDAIIDELGDVAEAAQGIDQSYSLSALTVTMMIGSETVTFSSAGSVFQETAADAVFVDCDRTVAPTGQPASDDNPS